ncbi:hypothetical protein HHI36_017933 [Cryptolaemus montrouzieri]|uniref:Cyclic GMP-AMP synthase-like n=1 Tax=Cryptolaemus montrouzieri TaxID=559131 RepID=A0ABD2NYV9_9CUCU
MENILNNINKRCIALAATDKKRSNVILHKVLDIIIKELTADQLFRIMFREKFFGGSYYDGLKVSEPTEFDIDLVLEIPKQCNAFIKTSDKDGFVHVYIEEVLNLKEEFKGLEQLYDLSTHHISAKKLSSWFESLLTKSLNKLCPAGAPLTEISIEGTSYTVHVKPQKSGPAFNININAYAGDSRIEINVDLVPCFQFTGRCWPSPSSGYRPNDISKHKGDKFLAVPKMPTDIPKPDFYWRLSFQEQERNLISGHELGRLKPALRLLKKLRDHWKHPIASYYIKTVFLWEVEKRSKEFWNLPLTSVFLEMLKIYGEKFKSGTIEYYWNERYNLISCLNEPTRDGIANKINNIVTEIERMSNDDPFVVAKHLVSPEELEILRKEVDIGKKKMKRGISQITPGEPTSNSPMKPQPPISSIQNVDCNEILENLKSDKTFKKMINEMVDSRVEEKLLEYDARKSIQFSPTTPTITESRLLQRNRVLEQENQELTRENAELQKEVKKLKSEKMNILTQIANLSLNTFEDSY